MIHFRVIERQSLLGTLTDIRVQAYFSNKHATALNRMYNADFQVLALVRPLGV